MSLTRFVLPALAAAGTAYAACSASATQTIQNSGDASALASCKTFSGSIAIATGTTDPINLAGVQKIDGDLIAKNVSGVQQIGADSLDTISGTFNLDTIQVLNSLSFPKLATVNSVVWNALPNLQNLDFGHQITKASTIDIQNTQLQSLKGINIEAVDKLYIANNRFISDISMQLGNVTTSLTLEANNPEVNVTFPNLIWAFNMTFRNCSSVDVPSLQSLNGSLGFYGNVFQSFSAANLTKVGGALSFVSNTEVTNISLPQLTEVTQGTLQIANNTKLSKIDGLGSLKTIGGALDINGNITSVSIPQLNDVKGAFNLQSTGDVSQPCQGFQSLKDKGKVQGKFVCQGSVAKPGGEGTTPSVTGANGAKKTGAASTLNVQGNAAVGLFGLAAAFLL